MNQLRQILIILLLSLLLYMVIVSLNNTLARFSISLTLVSLYLLFPTLYMAFWPGLLLVAFIALLLDALLPLPYGTSLLLFITGYILIRKFESRLRTTNRNHIVLIALYFNCAYMLVVTLLMGRGVFFEGPYWTRCLTDLVLSGLVLFIIAPATLEMQKLFALKSGKPLVVDAGNN